MTLEAAKGMLTYISHAYDYGDVYSRDDLEAIDTVLKALEEHEKAKDILNGTAIIFTSKGKKYVREDKILKYYIPKDKAREKIKELVEYKNNFWTTGEHDVAEDMDDYYELEQEIDLLQELLGE